MIGTLPKINPVTFPKLKMAVGYVFRRLNIENYHHFLRKDLPT
jgi:hypothetical protein